MARERLSEMYRSVLCVTLDKSICSMNALLKRVVDNIDSALDAWGFCVVLQQNEASDVNNHVFRVKLGGKLPRELGLTSELDSLKV